MPDGQPPPPTATIDPCYLSVALVGDQTAPTLLGLLRSSFVSAADEARGARIYPGWVLLLYSKRTIEPMRQIAGVLPLATDGVQVHNDEGILYADATARQIIPLEVRTRGAGLGLRLGGTVRLVARQVQPYETESTQRAIGQEVRALGQSTGLKRVQLDITGGTKLMSIGAFLAGEELRAGAAGGPAIAVRYVASETAYYHDCAPADDTHRWPARAFPDAYEELSIPTLLGAYGFGASIRR